MSPTEIKILNTLQAKQYPKTDSRNANILSIESRNMDTTWKLINHKIKIDVENINPMLWAKRLGGPGTNFSSILNLGTKTFVTSRARGLIFGPDDTLAKKP